MLKVAPVKPLGEKEMELAQLTRLTKLLDESRPRMLAVIERRSDSAVSARRSAVDVYQNACAKAQVRWHEFNDAGMSEFSWLYRIVLDSLGDDRDYHFRKKRSPRAEATYSIRSSLQLVAQLFDRKPGPRTEAERREEDERLSAQVAQIMELLNPSQREVLCMKFYDDLSHREIAELMRVTEITARQKYCRALIAFHDRWTRMFGANEVES